MNPTTSLLDRANLDRNSARQQVARALDGADDGELFLEYSQTEALMFDNGRLKQATYDTSQGFGLRAVKDDAVGYAHSSDVSLPALIRAADAVHAVRGGYSGSFAAAPPHTNVRLYGDENPLDAPGFESKVKLLAEIDAYVRDKEPRVRQVTVSFGATWQVVEILRPDGETYRDIRPLVRVNISVVAGQGDRQESGSKGYGGREGYARFIDTKAWRDAADGAIREALVNLESVPAPAGEMDVVLGAGWPGVMLHEAVGHGLEGDFNRKQTSAFAGLMGQQVAAKGVTVVDDGTLASRRGSLSIDDEGTPTNRTVLIEDGILVGYMQDRQNARLMDMKPTGNGRRQSYAHVPMPRMTNTYMLAGQSRSGRNPRIGQERHLCRQFRRRSGRHHLRQICVSMHRGVQDRKRQARRTAQGRDADRQRADRPASHHHGRQRSRARHRHRHLRQERPGRSRRGRPADAADGPHNGRRHRRMSIRNESGRAKGSSWISQLVQLAGIVLVVFVGKGALAEPFYVPSGSMEPTLRIGDALLATKFAYGYSTASLPIQINLPETGRVFAETPKRGDVVVFRWPGDRSQAWVKRVVGLPGDRIQIRQGQLFINDRAAELKPDGLGEVEDDQGGQEPAPRYVETLPGGVSHPVFKLHYNGRLDNTAEVLVPPGRLFVMGDNRDNSADSRVAVRDGGVGLLPMNDLVGRADAILASWDLGIRHQPVSTWLSGFRLARFFTAVH